MAGSAQEFALEINREWAETMGGLARAVVYIATEGLSKVQTKSPVDTGQFKSNWLVSVGALDTTSALGINAGAGAASAAALAAYPTDGRFPVVYLQNNLPYARRLESGYSGQAPNGMVALTVAELAALWNRMKV